MRPSFLQSHGWEAFQRSLGKEVYRGEGLLIKQTIGLGMHYWYGGRGVATKAPDDAVFLRLDLPEEQPIKNLVVAPHDVQPRTSIILDLTKPEDVLLAEMHQKTRYNIRVAERRGVTVAFHGVEALETFWQLLEATTGRNAFRGHGKMYYQKMLGELADAELKIFLAIASVDGKSAAAALMVDYAGTRTYLHGASDYHLREAMAPYALHWHLIKDAKAKGIVAYDFWGIAPTDDPKEKLAGVTRFKKGWGGEIVHYPKTQDLILRPWKYRIYRLARRLLTRP